jgi:hypothetical protein
MSGIFDLFEDMRRANADWYTANLADSLGDEELAELASHCGMTVEEMRAYLRTPRVEATCPLCGEPQTHLIRCTGCGGDAWGWEWEMVEGEDFANQLRGRLHKALTDFAGAEVEAEFTGAAIAAAVRAAYVMGGCTVCAECWNHTLPYEAFETCPLKLFGDKALCSRPEIGWPLKWFVLAGCWEDDRQAPEEWRRMLHEWLDSVRVHWLEHWNTLSDEATRQRVAAWRLAILEAAFGFQITGRKEKG